jgi:hypothetical protein
MNKRQNYLLQKLISIVESTFVTLPHTSNSLKKEKNNEMDNLGSLMWFIAGLMTEEKQKLEITII